MRARNHFNDVPSWSGVVELSGKKPWIVKIGAILTELRACEDAPFEVQPCIFTRLHMHTGRQVCSVCTAVTTVALLYALYALLYALL